MRANVFCATVSTFSVSFLGVGPWSSDEPSWTQDRLLLLLPASYRTASDDIAAANRHVCACIAKELDLQRLDRVFSWLWVAGRPMPRPLHHQLLLSRELFVAEQMDMHLVHPK